MPVKGSSNNTTMTPFIEINAPTGRSIILAPPRRFRAGLDWEGRGGDALLRRLEHDVTAESLAAALGLIEGAGRVGIHFGRWATQNEFFELWRRRPDARARLQPIAIVLGFALTERRP